MRSRKVTPAVLGFIEATKVGQGDKRYEQEEEREEWKREEVWYLDEDRDEENKE